MSHLQIVEHLVLQLLIYICRQNKYIVQLLHFCIQNVVNTDRKRTGREAVNCLWKEEAYLFKQFYRLLYKRAMYSVVHTL